MRFVQLTPGAGNFFSGAALRDHTLTNALRRLGHDVDFVPLLQKPMLEEEEAWEAPLFYDQARIYQQQQAGILNRFKSMFVDRKKAAKKIERMTPTERGELQVSLLQGKDGRQARELLGLIDWLKGRSPDIIMLSDALLMGLVPEIKNTINVPVIVSLQGEARRLDAMPKTSREEATRLVTEKAHLVDAFLAPSNYYAGEMITRFGLPADKVRTIPNGITLNHYSVTPTPPPQPTLGFLGRLCEANNLTTLLKAFKELRKGECPDLQLRLAGAMSDGDLAFIAKTLQPLNSKYGQDIKILRNIPLARKVTFLHSLTALCAPEEDEAFGLPVVEAMAVGLPVIAVKRGAFPELIDKTGGGIIAPDDPKKLAQAISDLLKDEDKCRELGRAGRAAALEQFSVEKMAGDVMALVEALKAGEDLPGDEPKPASPKPKKSRKSAGKARPDKTPAHSKPGADAKADDKPAEDNSGADDDKADDKPAEDNSGADAKANDKPAEDNSDADAKTDDKPAEDNSGADAKANDKPAEDNSDANDDKADDKPAEDNSDADAKTDDKPAEDKKSE